MAVTPLTGRAVEATAACRIALAGEMLSGVSRDARPAGALSIGVAVDRRPYARVETIERGVRFESRDTLLKLEVQSVAELASDGAPGLVRRVLEALSVSSGVRIATQARVPFEAGLGSASALAVAVGAAAALATGKDVSREWLAGLARWAEPLEPAGAMSGLAAVWGGVVATALDGRPESQDSVSGASSDLAAQVAVRLRVDPSRVEECLLLVDASSGSPQPPSPVASSTSMGSPIAGTDAPALAEIAGAALRVKAALEGARFGEIASLVAAEHEASLGLLPADLAAAVSRIAVLARECGGAARACGIAKGSLALVWAEPGERKDGPRERVQEALKSAGYRTFPCRVDLRGLEVEGPA